MDIKIRAKAHAFWFCFVPSLKAGVNNIFAKSILQIMVRQ